MTTHMTQSENLNKVSMKPAWDSSSKRIVKTVFAAFKQLEKDQK